MNLKHLFSWLAALALLATARAHGATINVSNDVTSATTWYASNTYILRTVVYVQTNAVLTIEPGTIVKGGSSNLVGRTGIPQLVSALWVTRGGKLYATGTVERPIIFTAEADPVDGTWLRSGGTPLSGQWGGVVLLGNARLNSAANLAGNAANPIYEVYEGTTGAGAVVEQLFGGSNDDDNSGALRYVSIRYPGLEFSTGRELNGLTMGGVGRGTSIEYVEVFGSSDDGFEWWGGTVNTKHLVAAFCEDDDFDTDQGYRGTNQFWFGIKPPWAGSTDSRGFETDGDLYQTAVQTNFPVSAWAVYNATLIGRGTNVTTSSLGRGWNPRDETAGSVVDSILTEFNVGVAMDADGLLYYTNSPAEGNALHNIFGVSLGTLDANGAFFFSDVTRSNTIQNPLLGGVSYTNNLGLNPRPTANSPALNNVLPQPAGLEQVNYRGAFAPYDNWADCWTALSTLGILNDGRNTVFVTNDITTTTTWFATNTYVLRSVIYVQTNATLIIEPGTVVKGGKTNLTGRTGIPQLVSALWVTRGGKLYATGTVDKPIIFTAEADNVNSPYDVPFATSGQWGGVVLLGNARLNSAANLVGNAANPIYEVYEGTTGAGAVAEQLFGGSNDDDSSGALRYVSIRYPGLEFSTGRELNGLTMGGVGRGTSIEYVEVFGSSDDGFEWWGGTVNTKHLVAAFCEDDDFDTDQGYRGTNQFWFGIKPPWAGSTDSRGFETDGDLYQTAVQTNFPVSAWAVYNATLIGRGTNVTTSSLGRGWNPRDETAGSVVDSILTEFNVGVAMDADGLLYYTNSPAEGNALHNIFGVSLGTLDANGAFLFSDLTRSNTIQNPLLGGVSYTNKLGLNPWPTTGSPALTGVLAPPAGLSPVTYRGAFNTNDFWAHQWSALYKLGYLQGTWYAPATVTPPTCAQPLLSIVRSGPDVTVSWAGDAGCGYELQSTTDLGGAPIVWTTIGSFSGAGPHSQNIPAAGLIKAFRVIVP